MPPTRSTASQLRELFDQMKKERQHHQTSLAEIDRTIAEFGLKLDTKKAATKASRANGRAGRAARGVRSAPTQPKLATRRGRRPAARKAMKRKMVPQSGAEFVLTFIQHKGSATTAEIVKQWTTSKRSGKADNVLSQLTKAGKIKREQRAGTRGSYYSLISPAAVENRPSA